MSLLLSTDNLSKSFGSRRLFKGISVSFDDTQKTGLIGFNGSGKSTLLKIIAGLEQPDEGSITMRRNLRIGYVPQEDSVAADLTVEQVVLEKLRSVDSHADAHELSARAGIALGKAGFVDFDQLTGTLSGGGKKRLAIARELAAEPDLLLMDEPTNHLDVEAILWLEKLLASARFSFLLVSHDRYFLENACNRIVELSAAYVDGYLSADGGYSDLLEKREQYLAAQQSQQASLAGLVRREVEWLRRGAKARTTKAKGRIENAGKLMDELGEIKSRNASVGSVQIDFNATHRQTRKLLEARGISKTLGGKKLIDNLSLILSPGARLGLIGANGSGKTTLINMLAGRLPPDSGEIIRAEGLRTILFDQGRAQLDPSVTLKRTLSPYGDSVVYRGSAQHVSGWARRFLFRLDQLDLPVGQLSGGEQARVLIANLMREPADLLILDEPTNDLDIATLGVLEESLLDFPGALVLVTHDRYMLERISTDLLALDGRGGAATYADLSQWQRARDAATSLARTPSPKSAKPAASASAKKLSYKEQREFESMEATIMEAESSLHALQHQMNDPAVLANRDRLHEVCEAVAAAQKTVQELYTRWEALEAKR
jgi:ATP-binding cassette subfamily F protein uup